jgi:hypothetical protein
VLYKLYLVILNKTLGRYYLKRLCYFFAKITIAGNFGKWVIGIGGLRDLET